MNIPSIDNLIVLADYFNVRLDDLLIVDNGTTEDILIQSIFGESSRITDRIIEAARYNAAEDAMRVYLKDYVLTHSNALVVALYSDGHCLMSYSRASNGSGEEPCKVFRVDFSSDTNMQTDIVAAVFRLKKVLPLENVMVLSEYSGFKDDGSFGKIVIRRENGEFVVLDPYCV